ncbi:cystine transporter subunit [Pseudodesulfovibrio hydrargyri]|uniref:Cystine transporter subunit n=1 Tax=Pseudodesulfovibrio hydrargyri TaxID=2125990 RepID=A0A1J5N2L6_9BACT|nr:transporter substrate-binding domain-containing protein [Pseudodesulfovibrio hydrargyri]OIQ49851.1 cystine transporter subunit [Pseudodesulfovibrio hydrargyri]
MKRIMLFMLMAVFMPCVAAAGPVKVTSGEYPPYTGEHLLHGGFVNHVLTEAFNAMGYEVRIRYYPWARAFAFAREGTSDAVSYVYVTERRGRDYWFSDPVTHERLVVFTKKETRVPEWESFKDFKGLRIGVTRDFSYTDEFWRLAEQGVLTLDVANNDTSNFAKLIEKRIDVFFADELVGFTILRERFAPAIGDMIKSSERAIAEHTGTLGFTRATPRGRKLRDAFNRGLKQLKDSGKFQAMYGDLLEGKYNH